MEMYVEQVEEGARATAHAGPSVALDFDGFYLRERPGLVRAVALATGNTSEAADAVDEAMARAVQRWAQVGRYAHPAGWVYRVAVNVARSRWRRARRSILGHGGDDRAADDASAAVMVDPALWSAVADLPRAQRDAVVLRFVLDWDHSRIADALEIEESSARSRVTRAIATLRTTLEVQP